MPDGFVYKVQTEKEFHYQRLRFIFVPDSPRLNRDHSFSYPYAEFTYNGSETDDEYYQFEFDRVDHVTSRRIRDGLKDRTYTIFDQKEFEALMNKGGRRHIGKLVRTTPELEELVKQAHDIRTS